MKAALFYGGADIRVETVPTPEPGPGEVLVRVLAAGICGSDLHGYRGNRPPMPGGPRLNGHELAGEVAAVGPGVTTLKVGQRVGVEPRHLIGCGVCRYCRRGDYHLCSELGQRNGQQVHSTGFAEYSLEDAAKVFVLPDDVSIEDASILDVYSCGVHALHLAPVTPMDSVVVYGAGAIGLTAAEVFAQAGARQVIVLANRPHTLAAAQKLGMTAIDVTACDPVEAVKDLTGGEGVEVVVEAVGGRGTTFEPALQMAATGGKVVFIGMYSQPQPLNMRLIHRREVSLHPCWSYALWNGVPEFKVALDMLADGRLQPQVLITHRFPLDEIGAGFAAADDKGSSNAIKVVINP